MDLLKLNKLRAKSYKKIETLTKGSYTVKAKGRGVNLTFNKIDKEGRETPYSELKLEESSLRS